MALPERLPVMLAPASAIVEAVSLRLSLMAPRRSMWLPLALRLPVSPLTLPSPMLGLFLVSATDVVSTEKGQEMHFAKIQRVNFWALLVGLLDLTGGSCSAADINFVFVVKFNSNSFAVPSRDATTSATAERDGHHAIDVGQHDGNANAWRRNEHSEGKATAITMMKKGGRGTDQR